MFDSYEYLRFERTLDGVLEVVLDNPPVNAVGTVGHFELARVWRDIEEDDTVRVALLRAEGRAFSAGGDFDLLQSMVDDPVESERVMREAGEMVRNILDCSKPIVSAINGAAVGAGLAAALLADIPIAGRSARIIDGHVRLGVAAGDHAALIWPLLMGIAKSKYYLLTNDPLDGTEAERIGLVARVVDDEDLLETARSVCRELATGSRAAIAATKQALNHWLRAAYPAFDASLEAELQGFRSPDAAEGLAAMREKRSPDFGRPAPA